MSQLQQIAKVNSPETAALLSKLSGRGGYDVSMLSFFDGKIYAGNVLENGPRRQDILVDVDKLNERRALGASGEADRAIRIDPFGETYKQALETWAKVERIHDETGVPVSRIVGAAASGTPKIATEYELVRRVNYLSDEVRGPTYVMETFNAINGVKVVPTVDLNVIGWARTAKLAGQPEIGDEQIPDIVKNSFTSYFKDIYADSIRYELGMREKQQSAISLEEQVTQDIPGAMAKMKDDKIITLMNAVADTTPTTDWDAVTGEHYTSDAAADIETVDNTLREYGGAYAVFMPRAIARAYRKNVGTNVSQNKDAISTPISMEKNRSFALPMNEHITAYVHDGITAASAVAVSRQWAILLQGPTIQVAYKNQFTPAQMEGRIYFDFNGVKEAVSAAAVQIIGLLT